MKCALPSLSSLWLPTVYPKQQFHKLPTVCFRFHCTKVPKLILYRPRYRPAVVRGDVTFVVLSRRLLRWCRGRRRHAPFPIAPPTRRRRHSRCRRDSATCWRSWPTPAPRSYCLRSPPTMTTRLTRRVHWSVTRRVHWSVTSLRSTPVPSRFSTAARRRRRP